MQLWFGEQQFSAETILAGNWGNVSAYAQQTLAFCQRWLRGDSSFTLHTSGSTGEPKPIELHRSQMEASARLTAQAVGLQPGMIVSNEPGFYKANSYGIRIENLQYVHAPSPIEGGERDMLGFTNLTWAALDRRLIAAELLSDTERNWVDHYHAQVIEKIEPLLDDSLSKWLKGACAPL